MVTPVSLPVSPAGGRIQLTLCTILVTGWRSRAWRSCWLGAYLLCLAGACGSGPTQEEVQRSMDQLRLAATYHREGDIQGALRHARESVSLDPDNARAYVFLGWVQSDRGAYDDAEVSVRRGIELLAERESNEGTLAEARNILGVVLIQQERYGEAVEILQASAEDELNRTPWFAYGNWGRALFEKGDLEESKTVLEHAVGIQPRFCLGYFYLGQTYYALGSLEDADRALTAAIESDERCEAYQDAYLLRGQTRARLGRSADAIADYERCIDLGTQSEAGRSCQGILESQ